MPVDSRLLKTARHKVVQAAEGIGIALQQAFQQEGKQLRHLAGGTPPPWSPAAHSGSLAAMALWQVGERERALTLDAPAWSGSGNLEVGLLCARLLASAARSGATRATLELFPIAPHVAPENPQIQAISGELAELEARFQQLRQDAESRGEVE